MASTFQLGDEQPSLKPTNLTKGAANSFNNLFGPPAPAKVDHDGDSILPLPILFKDFKPTPCQGFFLDSILHLPRLKAV